MTVRSQHSGNLVRPLALTQKTSQGPGESPASPRLRLVAGGGAPAVDWDGAVDKATLSLQKPEALRGGSRACRSIHCGFIAHSVTRGSES